MLHELAKAAGKRLLFYCAFGERAAIAVQAAQDPGLPFSCHLQGGLAPRMTAGGPLEQST
jgi:sulfur dioxygenase